MFFKITLQVYERQPLDSAMKSCESQTFLLKTALRLQFISSVKHDK